jgi:hypothetical protein
MSAAIVGNTFQCYKRQADRVGAKIGAGPKDAHAPVAAQARWANLASVGRHRSGVEDILEPYVGKTFETLQIRLAVERFEQFQGSPGVRHQAGLPGDTEFFFETGVNDSDGAIAKFHPHPIAQIQPKSNIGQSNLAAQALAFHGNLVMVFF